MARNRVPNLVKHCTLKIYQKGGIDGSTKKERFQSAWNIARARLAEYGYVVEGTQTGPAGRLLLTPKGRARNNDHRSERGGGAKSRMFDDLFEWILEDYRAGIKDEKELPVKPPVKKRAKSKEKEAKDKK